MSNIKKFQDYLNENHSDLNFYEKRKLLQNNLPVIVWRGIHKSGKNFYTGEKDLPFTYYTLDKEKANFYSKEGVLKKYIFNSESKPIKIIYQHQLFDKFGLNNDIESPKVINTLLKEGYSVALIKRDELVVFDKSLITEYNESE